MKSAKYRIRSEIFLEKLVYRAEYTVGLLYSWRAVESKFSGRHFIPLSYETEAEAQKAIDDHHRSQLAYEARKKEEAKIPLINKPYVPNRLG